MAKSIMVTYPGFYALPPGVKKLLLESESFFFTESRSEDAAVRARQTGFTTWLVADQAARNRSGYGWDQRAAA